MIGELFLPAPLRRLIEGAAHDAYPRECCGLIEGFRGDGRIIATAIHPARNIAAGRQRFAIDPAEHIRAVRAARARGGAIVGCYHSHPDGRPEPSLHDRENPGTDGFVWLIVAAAPGRSEMAAFAARGGNFQALRLAEPALA